MFSIVAIISYLATWIFLLHKAIRKEPVSNTKVIPVLAIGIAAHIGANYFTLFTQQGIQLGIFKISSLFFVVINMIVWLSSLRKPLLNLYLGLLPLSVLAIIISRLFDSPITDSHTLSAGIIAHILLSIIAYSLLTIATLQALLLAYQNRMLRKKHPGSIMGLMPPLQTMETLLFELIWGGMIFLTLSIATGFLFVEDFLAQKLSHKAVFSLLSWLTYAILLTGRHYIGWRGNTAIRWALGGFAALMLAYFGSKLVIEVVLNAS